MTEQLKDLERRLAEATGPDREIDLALMCVMFGLPEEEFLKDALGRRDFSLAWKFTSSIDSAVGLASRVLPGCAWTASNYSSCFVHSGEDQRLMTWGDNKKHPALALCTAIVRALMQKET